MRHEKLLPRLDDWVGWEKRKVSSETWWRLVDPRLCAIRDAKQKSRAAWRK